MKFLDRKQTGGLKRIQMMRFAINNLFGTLNKYGHGEMMWTKSWWREEKTLITQDLECCSHWYHFGKERGKKKNRKKKSSQHGIFVFGHWTKY